MSSVHVRRAWSLKNLVGLQFPCELSSPIGMERQTNIDIISACKFPESSIVSDFQWFKDSTIYFMRAPCCTSPALDYVFKAALTMSDMEVFNVTSESIITAIFNRQRANPPIILHLCNIRQCVADRLFMCVRVSIH
jgi:hypothetical protein